MASQPDPYRTLGLVRGASIDEVKRAYRRLVKANHPDAAGAGALARFLAIQAAYEQLAGGSGATGARARAAGTPSARPSGADADRAEATRRAYGGRARGRRRPADEEPQRPNGAEGAGAGAPGGAAPGGTAPGGAANGRGTRGATGRRGTRDRPAGPAAPRSSASGGPRGKATLGSTSYDDADAGPFEPDWGGASWYGTSSGTYWTINPKEYADPRKHGPEYQARARRASATRPDPGATAPDSPDRDRTASGPAHGPGWSWESTSGPGEPPDDGAGRARASEADLHEADVHQAAFADGPPPDPARAAADLVRSLADPRTGGLRGRIIRAFFGWLPIALGIGWLFGELTGCGRFAATCDTSADPLILGVQGAALVALVLLPVAASLAAMATLALLAAAVAAALVLSATGTAADEASRRATLGVLLVLAWFAGLAVAVAQRARSGRSRTAPVS